MSNSRHSFAASPRHHHQTNRGLCQGELTEAALEHFIAPGFAMKCGSSRNSSEPQQRVHHLLAVARLLHVGDPAAAVTACRPALHLSAACLRTRTARSGGGSPKSRCQIVPLSNWIVMPSGE